MKDGNFSWLIIALLVYLVGVPVAAEIDAISTALARVIAFSCLLGIGVLSLKGAGKTYPIAMGAAIVGIVLSILVSRYSPIEFVFGSFAAIALFLVIAITHTFRRIATDPGISANRIVGAIAVYLLMGVLWAVAYKITELVWPGSFGGFDPGQAYEWASEWHYFSFVTMTTLGYGDILPLSPIARVLAYMQAIVGQLYIAILVAGLVGAYVARDD